MARKTLCCFAILVHIGLMECQWSSDSVKVTTTADLNLIAVNDQTGDIYVGGKNYLGKFTSDLKLVRNETLRVPNQRVGNSYVPVDSNVVVLELDGTKKSLFVCSSAKACRFYTLDDLTEGKTILNDGILGDVNDGIRFDTKRPTSVVFLTDHGDIPTHPGDNETLLVATSYELLEPNMCPCDPVLSFRTMVQNGSEIQLQLARLDGNRRPYLDVSSDYQNAFYLRFISVNIYKNFSYFVMIQQTSVQNKTLTTKIARIETIEHSPFPYVEIPVECKKSPADSSVYNLATSAALGWVKDGENETPVLVIAFGKGNNKTAKDPVASYGSAVCAFRLQDIDIAMKIATDCQERFSNCSTPKIPVCEVSKWISTKLKCGKCRNAKGSWVRCAVSGLSKDLDSMAEFHLPNSLITSITAISTNPYLQVLIGTNRGNLLQFEVTQKTYSSGSDGKNPWQKFRELNISREVAIGKDTVVHDTYVYLLTGNKVTRVSWDPCNRRKTCSECVMDDQKHVCRWCDGTCRQVPWCNTKENTCSPTISNIQPRNSPLNGGILLTLTGIKLGGGSKNFTNVNICDQDCPVKMSSPTRVVCVVPPAPDEPNLDNGFACNISLYVKDEEGKVKLEGNTTSNQRFFYRGVSITGFHPKQGPKSGETNITIVGRNLDNGDTVQINIGALGECLLLNSSQDQILCTTTSLKTEIDNNTCASLEVRIGNLTLSLAEIGTFCYRHDPIITGIEPRKTIASGGIGVRVDGSNLDVVEKPRMVMTINGSEQEATECEANEDGSSMKCFTPNVSIPTTTGPVSAKVDFVMDGALKNFSDNNPNLTQIDVYEDPKVEKFNDSQHEIDPEDSIEIQVEGLKGVVAKNDIKLYVGKQACFVTTFTEEHVSCRLQMPFKGDNSDNTYAVTLKVGNLEVEIGKVKVFTSEARTNSSQETPSIWKNKYVFISLGVCFAVIVLIGVVAIMVVKRQRKKARSEALPSLQATYTYITEMIGLEVVRRKLDPKKLMEIKAAKLLIRKDDLQFGNKIGEGNFGFVYEGHLMVRDESGKDVEQVKVAVKTMKDTDTQTMNLTSFLDEAMLMKDFKHPNVLCLKGISFNEEKLPLVVLPFMERGDLLSYLENGENELTTMDIIKFAKDIADGMDYLSKLKFVHRDLAARNCMLDSEMRVKVADFGLCRDIYEKGYYRSDNKKKLPIRWMSPESIEGGTYSHKSDVWSLGVVIWEMYTRGVTPYPGVEGWDIIRFLRMGRRLEQPWFCPQDMYNLMLLCWMTNPDDRPGFLEISQTLTNMLETGGEATIVAKGTCAHYQNVQDILNNPNYYVLDPDAAV